MTKLRAAILTRVSTEAQAEHGHSLAMQRRRCMDVIDEEGLEFVGLEYEGSGESAYLKPLDARPTTARMLRDAEGGRFDVVVVWSSDRTQRDVDGESLYSALKRNDVSLYDVQDGWQDDSIQSVIVRGARRLAGHLESAQKSARMKAIARKRAEDGLPSGSVPFGYRPAGGAAPELVVEEADAVRRVFAMKRSGDGNGAIARWLNGQGFRTRRGLRFTAWAVRDLVQSPFFLGEVEYKGQRYPGRHEAIIDAETFAAVQPRRD